MSLADEDKVRLTLSRAQVAHVMEPLKEIQTQLAKAQRRIVALWRDAKNADQLPDHPHRLVAMWSIEACADCGLAKE